MMKWIQLAIFAVRMVLRYGPKLWNLGKQIYDDIESRGLVSTEAKARAFNNQAELPFTEIAGYMPTRPTLNEFRESVWRYRNPWKNPQRLKDARLRIGKKRTKEKA